MDRMHAPWRIDYIKSEKDEGCVLCNAANAEDDRQALVLHRGKQSYIIMNKYPYTNGHLMVAPYEHIGDLNDFDAEAGLEIMALTQLCVRALEKVAAPHGFNIGMNIGRIAGAGVEGHLHMHIVPRWNGDVNFMPVLADVRVINQHIEEVYADLVAVLAELTGDNQ